MCLLRVIDITRCNLVRCMSLQGHLNQRVAGFEVFGQLC